MWCLFFYMFLMEFYYILFGGKGSRSCLSLGFRVSMFKIGINLGFLIFIFMIGCFSFYFVIL